MLQSLISGLKQRMKKKKLLFSLPTKATIKELRITLSLLWVVICHASLSLPHAILFVFYTAFSDFWGDIKTEKRVLINGSADALISLNYSINFYVHFIANKDIRDAAMDIWNSIRGKSNRGS